MPATVNIVSFGYLHAPPPAAHITIDVREHFRDPHVSPALRQLTAHDQPVVQAVMNTPGIPELAAAIAVTVHAFQAGPSPAPLTVAVGCAGGRHRSAQLSLAVAQLLRDGGQAVTVDHRDIDQAVVARYHPRLTWVVNETPGNPEGTRTGSSEARALGARAAQEGQGAVEAVDVTPPVLCRRTDVAGQDVFFNSSRHHPAPS